LALAAGAAPALVAPGQLLLLPLSLADADAGGGPLPCPSRLTVAVEAELEEPGGGWRALRSSQRLELTLECRGALESVRFTFLGPDGSVCEAAAVAPWAASGRAGDLPAAVPVVLSLHGTGVEPRAQCDSYKFMPKAPADPGWVGRGKYRFGVAGAWLVAAERQGAHNWDTATGRDTALGAADALGALAAARPLGLPAADPARLVYAGHSMGGHGARGGLGGEGGRGAGGRGAAATVWPGPPLLEGPSG
jgi:hypothetical protein